MGKDRQKVKSLKTYGQRGSSKILCGRQPSKRIQSIHIAKYNGEGNRPKKKFRALLIWAF